MKRINVAFGIHNHQPVGNFDFVFEEAFAKAYQPFLELLEKHPQIRLAQHYSGILLDWLEQHKPDFLRRTAELVKRNQVEMISGGFYEPIMSVIPDRDKRGQIDKLSHFIREHFDYEPVGMWLAERIWEPHLPATFVESGIKYVVLDDSHFKNAGLRGSELHGYYLTEEAGQTIALFPICEKLRYTIPFSPPEETIDFLRENATEDGNRLIVFADDGEKFGIWPRTYEHCYEDGWLESFFKALEDNLDWINILHLNEILDEIPPSGRVYLPAASYREMMEWAMPTRAIHEYEELEASLKQHDMHERYKAFVRGGFWRNFMVKYPESNNMHKKMLNISNRMEGLVSKFGDSDNFIKAQDNLWAGQCNCPYWHGVFGGLYLNHLRFAIYNKLIEAEKHLDKLEHGNDQNWLECNQIDFDGDGHDELLISTAKLSLYVSPAQGGGIVEWDVKSAGLNLLDSLTRREEAYHKRLLAAGEHSGDHANENEVASIHDIVMMKEEGLDKKLVFDRYRRIAGLDHFLGAGVTIEDFAKCDYDEVGDFLQATYESATERDSNQLIVHLSRHGQVHGEPSAPVYLSKRIVVRPDSNAISISYRIMNHGNKPRHLRFGSEWNFALLAGDAPDRYFVAPGRDLQNRRLNSTGEEKDLNELRLVDEWLGVDICIRAQEDATFWRTPIETISQSEGGFERVYQSSVVMPIWAFELQPKTSWQTALTIEVNTLK